jgi:hypothetical protein
MSERERDSHVPSQIEKESRKNHEIIIWEKHENNFIQQANPKQT